MTHSPRRSLALLATTATFAATLTAGLATGAAAAPVASAPVASAAGVTGCARTLAAYPVLRPGAHGPAVRTLQCALDDLGAHLVVDGDYGPRTRAAVRRIEDGFEGPRPHPGLIDAGFWTLLYGRQLHRSLHLGMQGPQVTVLQRALRAAGGTLSVDGRFGPQTRSVVRAYQRAQRLKPSGRADNLVAFYLGMGGTF